MEIGWSTTGPTDSAVDLAELFEAVPADLPEAALVEHLLSLHRVKARLDAAVSAATNVFDAKKT